MTEKIDSSAGYFLTGLVIGAAISVFFAPSPVRELASIYQKN